MVEPFITARLVQCGVGIVIDQSYNASRAPAYPRLVGLRLRRSGIDRTEVEYPPRRQPRPGHAANLSGKSVERMALLVAPSNACHQYCGGNEVMS